MRSHSISSRRGNKILFGIASIFAAAWSSEAASTFSFDNGLSSNAWNVQQNWSPDVLPTAVDTAFVNASFGDTLYLTDGVSSAPAEIATLNFTGTPSNQYQFLAGFGSTAKDITFGVGGATPTFATINSFSDANVIFGKIGDSHLFLRA